MRDDEFWRSALLERKNTIEHENSRQLILALEIEEAISYQLDAPFYT